MSRSTAALLVLLLSLPAFAAERSVPQPARPVQALPQLGPMAGLVAPAQAVGAVQAPALAAVADAARVPGAPAVAAEPSAKAMQFVEGLMKEMGQHEPLPDETLSAVFDGAPQNDSFLSRFLAPTPKNGRINLSRLRANPPADAKSQKKLLKKIAKNLKKIDREHLVLMADRERRVLVILHAPNAGGKDGTIHDNFSLTPMGVHASGFKKPTPQEAKEHYLKRVIRAIFMAKGHVSILNRSHLEDLIVPVVYPQMYEKAWGRLPSVEEMRWRVDVNNAFEKYLADRGWAIMKVYLHITKEEQGRRLRHRRDTEGKRFKLEDADLIEHNEKWAPTIEANGRLIAATDTPWARWFLIPANDKTYRNYSVTGIFKRLLESLKLHVPPAKPGVENAVIKR